MTIKLAPAVRFPGFTDVWEQRKLGELCEEFQSGKNIKAEDIKDNGPFPVFGGMEFVVIQIRIITMGFMHLLEGRERFVVI